VTAARTSPSADPMVRYGVTVVDPPDMTVSIERTGPSWVASVAPLGAQLVFREVRLDRDPAAEVAVSIRGRHLFRTTSTLSLTGRDRIAKTAFELGHAGSLDLWRLGTFTAVEKVLEAEGRIETIDLRTAAASARRPVFIGGHFEVDGPTLLVMPGESGKSTLTRALAVGHAAGREIVPGIPPRTKGPVLYVAAEAPLVASHWRSLDAICRGAGISLAEIDNPIRLYAPHGKPLHRVAREVGEMAKDYALVVLDSLQALLSVGEHSAGVRERDTMFWNAIDQIERATAIVAHPNREDAQRWNRSDGRAAGSDVTRDRARISWKGTFRDEDSPEGQSYRRYTLRCTKFNDGPRPAPIGLGVQWIHGIDDDDPGTVYFIEREPEARGSRQQTADEATDGSTDQASIDSEMGPAMRETMEAWEAGARTPAALRKMYPKLGESAAKARLARLKEHLEARSQTTLDGAS
jgi:hypothetical protein